MTMSPRRPSRSHSPANVNAPPADTHASSKLPQKLSSVSPNIFHQHGHPHQHGQVQPLTSHVQSSLAGNDGDVAPRTSSSSTPTLPSRSSPRTAIDGRAIVAAGQRNSPADDLTARRSTTPLLSSLSDVDDQGSASPRQLALDTEDGPRVRNRRSVYGNGPPSAHPSAPGSTVASPRSTRSHQRADSTSRQPSRASPARTATVSASAAKTSPARTSTVNASAAKASPSQGTDKPSKPREEQSFAEYFPELDVDEPLVVLWNGKPRVPNTVHASASPIKKYLEKRKGYLDGSEQGDGGSVIALPNGNLSSSLTSLTDMVHGVVEKFQRRMHGGSDQEMNVDKASTSPQRQSRSRVEMSGSSFTAEEHSVDPAWVRPRHGPLLKVKGSLADLPVVTFRQLDKNERTLLAGSPKATSKQQKQTASGKQPVVAFERTSDFFMRYIEPSEEELDRRVEYDMDEQDLCWLQAANALRDKEDMPPVTEDVFELIMDQLEKEWFHLTKDIQRLNQEPWVQEESACNICNSNECENSNAIVFCDGCNLAVHQECYGVPYIPEGQWLCRKCMLSPEKQVSCIFCPNSGGAFKQTTTNKWAHLLCTIWIPEVAVANPVYMEPVDYIDRIPKSRWRLVCYLCKKKMGACIQCYKSSCFQAYHVTCARKANLYMKVKHSITGDEDHSVYRSFCDKHTPHDYRRDRLSNMNETLVDGGDREQQDDEHQSDGEAGTELPFTRTITPENRAVISAAQRKELQNKRLGYNASAPVCPEYILNRILDYLESEPIVIKQKHRFVTSVCRYWALKLASRRGAPLLKRLHLEPWTAFSSTIRANEALMLRRFKTLHHLREDLEKARMLAELVRKREKEKLRMLKLQMEYILMRLRPLDVILRRTIESIRALDKNKFFWHPVDATLVPDYHDIIKRPMNFDVVISKIEERQYDTLEAFQEDVDLIFYNAIIYNKAETPYARLAWKLRKLCQEVYIPNATESLTSLDLDAQTGMIRDALPDELFAYPYMDPSWPIVMAAPPPPPAYQRRAVTPSIQELDGGTVKGTVISSRSAPPSTAPRKRTLADSSDELHKRLKTDSADQPSRYSSLATLPSTTSTGSVPIGKSKQTGLRTLRLDAHIRDVVDLLRKDFAKLKRKAAPVGKTYRVGDLAWGKLDGFPWFPLEIANEKQADEKVAQRRKSPAERFGHFFDRDLQQGRSWTWLTDDRLAHFDHGAEDVHKLKLTLKQSSSTRKQVLTGYYAACMSRGIDPAPVLLSAGFAFAE